MYHVPFSVDNQAPSIQCPQNQQSTVCTGAGSTAVTWPAATGTDNCPGVLTYSYQGTAGVTTFPQQSSRTATFNQGTSTVLASVTDANGQTTSCTFTVTVSGEIRLLLLMD